MPLQIVSNTNDVTFRVNGQDALVVNKNGLITTPITTRQTVELGTVDSNGFAAFGGSTGSTTVTTATTLYLNAANGMVNRRGSITNPSWTGLSTPGTMYLYLDIAADGTCTSGSGTLAPVYQHGGTYSTTSGQFTFNIQEMQGQVGNGATAAQTYRVYIGEVVVSGGSVVASIIWYALNGRYDSGWTSTTPAVSTKTTKTTYIGAPINGVRQLLLKNLTSEFSYSIGDIVDSACNSSSTYPPVAIVTTNNSAYFLTGNTVNGIVIPNTTTGALVDITPASWAYKVLVERGW